MKLLSDPGLVRTQRWMQAFILAEGDHETALAAPQVEAEIPKQDAVAMVLPSTNLTSVERVGIYRDMYLGRLSEVLEGDYPGVRHFLGEEKFQALVESYVDAHPSRSYTLNRLGDRFPGFLAGCGTQRTPLNASYGRGESAPSATRGSLADQGVRPTTESDPGAFMTVRGPWLADHVGQASRPARAFLHDLARLELALTEIFDEQESPVLSAEAIASVPVEAWPNARLRPIAALRLLSFRYPVSEYLGAVAEENPFPKIRKKQTWVIAYRTNYRVQRLDLKRSAFDLLTALFSGVPVGQAVEQCRVSSKQLFTWFREWTAEGLFQSVSLD
jgi:hypothetical protein